MDEFVSLSQFHINLHSNTEHNTQVGVSHLHLQGHSDLLKCVVATQTAQSLMLAASNGHGANKALTTGLANLRPMLPICSPPPMDLPYSAPFSKTRAQLCDRQPPCPVKREAT